MIILKPLQFVTFTSVRENQMEVSYMMLDNGDLVHSSILNIGRQIANWIWFGTENKNTSIQDSWCNCSLSQPLDSTPNKNFEGFVLQGIGGLDVDQILQAHLFSPSCKTLILSFPFPKLISPKFFSQAHLNFSCAKPNSCRFVFLEPTAFKP